MYVRKMTDKFSNLLINNKLSELKKDPIDQTPSHKYQMHAEVETQKLELAETIPAVI